MNRLSRRALLAPLLAVLALLLGLAGSASAAFNPAATETPYCDFLLWEAEASASASLQLADPSMGNGEWVYDDALGVPVYVRQNPWTYYDPLGLSLTAPGAHTWHPNAPDSNKPLDPKRLIKEVKMLTKASFLQAKQALVVTGLSARNLVESVNMKIGIGIGLEGKADVGPVKVKAGAKVTQSYEFGFDGEQTNSLTGSGGVRGDLGPFYGGAHAEHTSYFGYDEEGNIVGGEEFKPVLGGKVKQGKGSASDSGKVGVNATVAVVEVGVSVDVAETYQDTMSEYRQTETAKEVEAFDKEMEKELK